MVKGIQRRFVEMKLSGSKAYESAYFILRQSGEAEKRSESEYPNQDPKGVEDGRKHHRHRWLAQDPGTFRE